MGRGLLVALKLDLQAVGGGVDGAAEGLGSLVEGAVKVGAVPEVGEDEVLGLGRAGHLGRLQGGAVARPRAAFRLLEGGFADEDVCLAGEVMPEKSTYFYPKLADGLVFDCCARRWE